MATRRPSGRRRSPSRGTRRPPRPAPFRLLRLEDRCLPAAIVVTVAGEDANPGDGNVSLREALAVANSNNQPDTITFAAGITEVTVTEPAALHVSEAGAANATTIDGGGVTIRRAAPDVAGVLAVDFNVFAQLRGLTLTGGNAGGLIVGFQADATLDHVTVSGNTNGGNGGGIVNRGALRLTDCTVAGNTAVSGGGIFSKGQLFLRNSTVRDNTASNDNSFGLELSPGSGGGIAVVPSLQAFPLVLPGPPPAEFVAVNSTVSGNRSSGNGGGVFSSSFATLRNVTITNNRAGTDDPPGTGLGGGQFTVGASVRLFNSIVSGNFRGSAGTTADDLSGSLNPESNHNLIGGSAKLGPLADNGGPTKTHALLPGSPAINGGRNAAAVDADGTPLATDQRGSPRVFDRTVDIGAYELQQVTPATPGVVVAGSGAGEPRVNVYSPQGPLLHSFLAYARDFAGGVRVATGDVNADGVPDVITAAGPGGAPHVKVFDGTRLDLLAADGQLDPAAVLASFYAYDRSFAGGVSVAAADVNGDGHADVVTGAGAGGAPHVRVIDGVTGQENRSFYAYDVGFAGGVTVGGGDVDADGLDDVVTGAGPGGGPHVKVFSGLEYKEIRSFFAFDPGFHGGVFVAAGRVADALTAAVLGQPPAGDPNAEIFVGAGPGGGPHVKIISGATGGEYQSFYAYDGGFGGGVRVAADDLDGDGLLELVTAPGPGIGPRVREFFSASEAEIRSFFAFDPGYLGGVFVG